jgi:Arc/MetJ-type ribon-helix-helix transcriptional regulator
VHVDLETAARRPLDFPRGLTYRIRSCHHIAVTRTPALVQLDDDLIARLDSRATAARRSRSDLIREAIERYLTADLAAAIDAAIVDSYTRIPPDEDFGAAWAARASIEGRAVGGALDDA